MAWREILKPIPAIVGPTASGKTALSLALGQALDGEIVCCDSMQIYREMDIGTAKPTPSERAVLPHHMLDFLPPGAPYSAADYAADALSCIEDILARGKTPLLCGGTGLYLSSLRRGGAVSESPPADPALREELCARGADEEGRKELHSELAAVDPEAAAAIHPNNLRRVVRALEIYRLSGRTKTAWDALSKEGEEIPILPFGLRYSDRALLSSRIEKRVDVMLGEGLIDEVRRLYDAGVLDGQNTASQAIGYKEIIPYLRGECSLSDARKALILATRHYAKRQMTWFSADQSVYWLTVDREDGSLRPTEDLTAEALAVCRERGV